MCYGDGRERFGLYKGTIKAKRIFSEQMQKARNRKENNMDAVKFLREYKRICLTHCRCKDCPLYNAVGSVCSIRACNDYDISEAVEIVENWSRENPEELGKKYVIEIDKITINGLYRIKGTTLLLDREELKTLEEYNESEE